MHFLKLLHLDRKPIYDEVHFYACDNIIKLYCNRTARHRKG